MHIYHGILHITTRCSAAVFRTSVVILGCDVISLNTAFTQWALKKHLKASFLFSLSVRPQFYLQVPGFSFTIGTVWLWVRGCCWWYWLFALPTGKPGQTSGLPMGPRLQTASKKTKLLPRIHKQQQHQQQQISQQTFELIPAGKAQRSLITFFKTLKLPHFMEIRLD